MHSYNFLEHILFPGTSVNAEKLKRQLEGKTILITGASSGIGEELAYMLAPLRVRIILVARREEKLLALKKDIEMQCAEVIVFAVDLRDQAENEKLLAFLHQLPNGLDIIVSNAGHSIKRSLHQSLDRYHDVTRTMAINYFAPVQLLLSLIPLIEQKQGQIINISSVNPLLHPLPHWAAYQASKSAFDVWFRSVAPELNMMGISTSTIYFPLVRTPMILPTAAYSKMPAMSAEDAAKVICNRLYTKRKVYKPWWLIFGQLASLVCRGYLEYSIPRRLRKKEHKK